MRCSPLAVYSHMLSKEDLRKTVTMDGNFTHCNKNVIDAVYLYCYTIGQLISSAESDVNKLIEDTIASTIQVCK